MRRVSRLPSNLLTEIPSDLDPDLVTVVIPARNEAQFIAACLDSVLAQRYENVEVLVVDGDSSDGTQAIVRDYCERDGRVRLLANPARIVPTGLNRALEAAAGAWLVRIDAHSTVPPDYVDVALERLRTGRWGGVGGRKNGKGITPSGRAVAAAMSSRFGVGDSVYHYGTQPIEVDHIPFGAYPTWVARSIGGWSEHLVVNQDFEFDYRLRSNGYKLLFDPQLRIDWHCRQSIRDLFRQYLRYGRGKFVVMAENPDSIQPRHLAAPLLVLATATAASSARRRPRLAAALTLPYVVGLTGFSIVTARQLEERSARAAVPAAFAAMHFGWGIGFWRAAATATARRIRTR